MCWGLITGAKSACMQVLGQSSVGVTNTTFLGCVNANSEGGALVISPNALVQVLRPQSPLLPSCSLQPCSSKPAWYMYSTMWLLARSLRHMIGVQPVYTLMCKPARAVQIVNSQFVANSATRGGAMYASSAMLSIVNSAFTGNTGRTTGGAVYASDSSALTLLNSTFTANTAGVHAAHLRLNTVSAVRQDP